MCGLLAASAILYPIGIFICKTALIAAAAFSTAFYEIGMRQVINCLVKTCFHESNSARFKIRKWENKFYRIIRLHSIKGLLPPYNSEILAVKNGTAQAITGTMITEISNEIIIPLGYLPLIFALILKSGIEFVVSLGAIGLIVGLYDLIMLFAQRYNRFRLISLRDKYDL